MRDCGLENFGAYRKAKELFDLVVSDTGELRKDPRCYRLIAQQVASTDSICANMEEGYGRLSRAECVRFLDFSRGSARETGGRYERLKHWLPPEIIRQRAGLADEIIAILTKTIQTLQHEMRSQSNRASYLKDELPPSTLDTRHSLPDEPGSSDECP
jgi:four helix bundle protein